MLVWAVADNSPFTLRRIYLSMWANSVNSLVFLHSVIRNLKCMQWSQTMWNKYWGRRYFSLFSQLTWSATAPARNRNEKRATHTTASKLPLAPAQVLFEKKEKRGNSSILVCTGKGFKKGQNKALVSPVQGGVEQREEEWQMICLGLTCTFLWDSLTGLTIYREA